MKKHLQKKTKTPNSVFRLNYVIMLFALFFANTFFSQTQISVSATAGTASTSYATLKAAFDAINAGTHQGVITIGVTASTTETATAALNASGSGSAVYSAITISPTGGAARTISGAIAAGSPLINLNGADNVTFDGLNTGGNSLTISNTTVSATLATSTIRFINDASNNTITNCSILGSSTGAASAAGMGGNIFFSTGATTGNDNNTISNCDITKAGSNLPTKAIGGLGSVSNLAAGNSGITINNNNIYDIFGASVASAGIFLQAGCNTWTITNNKFYQTATRTFSVGVQHSAIWAIGNSATTGLNQAHTITGNTIGYANNLGTGTYTLTGSTGKFVGIFLNAVTGATVSNISSNTISNISISNAATGTGSSGQFLGIYIANGVVDANSNIIGSNSSTGAISITTSGTLTTESFGIYNFSSDNFTSNSNQIGGINVANSSSTGSAAFAGLRCNSGATKTWTCNNNVIGGNVANSIFVSSTAGGSNFLAGILNTLSTATVTNNQVSNLTNNNGTGAQNSSSIVGIDFVSTSVNNTVSYNSIYNLKNTNASAATNVVGLYYTSSTGTNVIEGNNIHSLTTATTSAAALINGIQAVGGTVTYRNNMIAVGAGIANASLISGIFNSGGTNNFWNNSVYIGGAPTAGAGNSFAFRSTETTAAVKSFRNNIFQNSRTNAGATGFNYAITVAGTAANPSGLTINNNIYYSVGGANNIFGLFNAVNRTTLAEWQTAVGQDVASYNTDPGFLDPTNATPNLHINPATATFAEGFGTDLSITLDFDGQTRSDLTPVDIGADAGTFTGPPAVTFGDGGIDNASTLCAATARYVDVTTTAGSTPIVSMTLNYWFNGVAQTPIALTDGTTTGTSTWTGTIPAAVPGNAVVTWNIVAVDGITTGKTFAGTSYFDEPLYGTTVTASSSLPSVCPSSTVDLTAVVSKPGSVQVGSGTANSSTGNSVSSFYGTYWGNGHAQILYRASELTALGFKAGNITKLGVNITTLGSPAAVLNFSIKMAHTGVTAITTFQAPTFTTVFSAATYTPVIGLNQHTFSTPFNWDGVSNIIIDYCFQNGVTGSTSAVNTMTTTAFGSFVNFNADGNSAACGNTTVSNTSTNRPNLIFTGNVPPVISSYTWNDGASNIGSTNPYTATVLASTSYTVTAADANGCTVASSPVAVSLVTGPTIDTQPVASAKCTGQSTTFTVAATGPGLSYIWYKDGSPLSDGGTISGATTATLSISSIVTADAGTYTVQVSAACGTPVLSDGVSTLSLNPTPSATTAGTFASCVGGDIQVNATSDIGTTFSWTGPNSYTSSSLTNTISAAAALNAGTYAFTASTAFCTSAPVNLVVSVNTAVTGLTYASVSDLSSVCPGASVNLSTVINKNGNVTLGAGGSTSAASAVTPFRHNYGGAKTQYIIRSSELTALGLIAGNITSLGLNITALGTTTLNAFSINVGHTAQTVAVSNTAIVSGLTQVYTNPAQTLALGVNTYTFSTPFVWNGTSNIVISFNFSNNNSGGTSTTVTSDAAGFLSSMSILADDATEACILPAVSSGQVCMGLSTNGTSSNRPRFFINGNATPTFSSYTWSDGASNVGTGNPLSVVVPATTSYTVTALSTDGCSYTDAASVTITNASGATINTQPVSDTKCTTQATSFTVAATGPALTYAWYRNGSLLSNGGTISGATTATLSISSVASGDAGTYTVDVIPQCGATVTSDGVSVLTVNETPTASATSPITICEASTINLVGTTNVGTTFTWSGPLAYASTNATNAIASAIPTNSGTYIFTAFNGTCASIPANVVVRVNAKVTGLTYASTASLGSVCPGASVDLSTSINKTGIVNLGAGVSTSSASSVTPFRRSYGGAKTQYIIKSTELSALGLLAGNITSLGLNITSLGDTPLLGFSISVGHTAQNVAVANTLITSGLTQVYTNASQALALGVNSYTFATPFAWDGASNIVVSFNFSNGDDGGGTSTAITSDDAGFLSSAVILADNSTEACLLTAPSSAQACMGFSTNNTSTNRPRFFINGNATPTFSSYTWNDGSANIGTGNPLNITPSATASYTVTALGVDMCSYTDPTPVVVNVVSGASITTQPAASASCTGVPATFTVAATGPELTYAWYKDGSLSPLSNGGTISGATTATLSISSLAFGDAGTYTVVVTPSCGASATSDGVSVLTVTQTPTASATSPITICEAASINLAGTTDIGTTFTWSGPLAYASTNETNTISSAIPTNSGTYVFTAFNGACPSIPANVVVTVNAKATGITYASVSDLPSVCPSVSVNLSTTLIKAISAQVGDGTENILSSTTKGAFYGNYYGNGHAQILYRASELQAIGLKAGNITKLGINITGLGSPNAMSNYTIKMASTAETAITTFQAPVFTTVYSAASFAPIIGLNEHVFSTPFVWDGVSNVIIDYCFANGGAAGSTGAINKFTATTFGSFVNFQSDTDGSACDQTTVSNTSSNRPNLIFTGSGAPIISTYTWNDGSANVGTGNPLNITPPATTSYTVTALGTDMCSYTDPTPVAVTVVSGAAINTQPVASANCTGTSASFTVAASGPSLTYKWYKNGTEVTNGGTITGATTATLSISSVALADAGTYTVDAIPTCGSTATSDGVSVLTVTQTPTASVTTPVVVCETNTINLAGTSDVGTSYVWSGPSSYSANNLNSAVSDATVANAGTYIFTAYNGACPSLPANALVTVNVNPTSVAATSSVDYACEGSTFSLGVTAGAINPTILTQNFESGLGSWTRVNNSTGGTPVNASWNIRANNYPTAGTWSQTLSSNTANSFLLSNSDSQGSAGTTATEFISPAFSTVGFSSMSLAFNHYFKANGDAANVLVSTDGVTYTAIQTYTATTGAAASFASASIDLSSYVGNSTVYVKFTYASAWGYGWALDNIAVTGVPTPYNYSWTSNPAGYTSATQNPAGVSQTATTDYIGRVTNSVTGCFATSTKTVNHQVVPTIDATTSTLVCGSGTSVLTATSGIADATLNWYDALTAGTFIGAGSPLTSPSISAGTSYYVDATKNGCTTAARTTVDVTVNPILVPSVVITSDDADNVITPLTLVTFTATPTNGGATPSYQWKLNGVNVGTNSPTYTNSTLNSGNGVTCLMTTSYSCPSVLTKLSNTITMTVNNAVSNIASVFCGSTLVDNSTDIYSGSIIGATIYEYKLVNGDVTLTIQKPSRTFKMSQVPGCLLGVTYQVSCRAFYNGAWSAWGTVCPITTRGTEGGSKIIASQCGAPVSGAEQNLYAEPIMNATQYKFRVTNGENVQVITKSSRTFKLAQLATVYYGATNVVDVDVFVNGAWIGYGPTCNIIMPAAPSAKIQTSQCGAILGNIKDLIYANQVFGATQYRFRVVNEELGYNQTIVKASRVFRLSELAGIAINTTYVVDVDLFMNGAWLSSYGVPCNITTPGSLARLSNQNIAEAELDVIDEETIETISFDALVFPNPYIKNFSVSLTSENDADITIKVTDVTGKLIENVTIQSDRITELTLGENYQMGMYHITITQGNSTKLLKVIKN